MDIVCRKSKCIYNNNQRCTNKKITVDNELNCTQYKPVEKNSLQDISKNMLEVAPEIAPFKNAKKMKIKCYANCIFNKKNECMANGIIVNGVENLSDTCEQNFSNEDCGRHKKDNNKSLFEEKSLTKNNECAINTKSSAYISNDCAGAKCVTFIKK